MGLADTASLRLKRTYGWIGLVCWILILPAKGARYLHVGLDPMLVGIAPSLLGPAGLLLVILSNEGRFAGLTIRQATLMAGTIAIGLECAQILPWVRRIYRFDWLDVAATLLSLVAGALASVSLRHVYGVGRVDR